MAPGGTLSNKTFVACTVDIKACWVSMHCFATMLSARHVLLKHSAQLTERIALITSPSSQARGKILLPDSDSTDSGEDVDAGELYSHRKGCRLDVL